MSKTRAHVIVSGRVQGVCFRAFTIQSAEGMGLKGWVKNLSNGNVEAVFEGDETSVREAVRLVGIGPARAKVLSVDVSYEDYTGEFGAFSILP